MIAPMKTVLLVLLERDKASALVELRKLGLVHIETSKASGRDYERARESHEIVSKAMNIVPALKGPGDASLRVADGIARARRVVELDARVKAIYEESGLVSKELERCALWGEWDPSLLSGIEARGLKLRFFSGEAKRLESLGAEEGISYIVLSRGKKEARFALIGDVGRFADVTASFVEFQPPRESTQALRERLEALRLELASTNEELASSSAFLPSLRKAQTALDQAITLETVRTSFAGEGSLAYMKGYVPSADAARFSKLAAERGWGIAMDDPSGEDAPPTKTEYAKGLRIAKPIFDFLKISPAYTEYEISPSFLLFFCLFFAMIFGDAGYGLIMLVAALVLLGKGRKKGKGASEASILFLVLSISTILWGVVTATWFSIPVESLPPFLLGLAIWPISGANPQASQNVQVFCFILGLIQLSFARLKNIKRDFPNPKFIAQVGSLALVWGMFFLVLNLVADAKRFPVPPYALWLIVGGFAANLVFGAYDGNVLKSFIEGLKGIIPTFLGSVGVFADIVSYIRLWALGLAGSSLASIINSMGGGMFKAITMAGFGVILLVFGHTLNMALSVLSVVVHDIRLNILEYSCNHLGMQWSGIEYDPFRITSEEEA